MTIPLKTKELKWSVPRRRCITKEYDEKWTGDIFTSTQRIMRGGLPIYRLKDFHDEEIKGTL